MKFWRRNLMNQQDEFVAFEKTLNLLDLYLKKKCMSINLTNIEIVNLKVSIDTQESDES